MRTSVKDKRCSRMLYGAVVESATALFFFSHHRIEQHSTKSAHNAILLLHSEFW